MVVLNSVIPGLVGQAFDAVLGDDPDRSGTLTTITVLLLVIVIGRSVFDLLARLSTELLAKRMERGARDELYVSLLGKSQTFHNRQRVGDLMARARTRPAGSGSVFSPGIDLMVDSLTQGIVPIIFIAFLDPRLLVAPLLFALTFVWSSPHLALAATPVEAGSRHDHRPLGAGQERRRLLHPGRRLGLGGRRDGDLDLTLAENDVIG